MESCRYCDAEYRRRRTRVPVENAVCPRCVFLRELERRQAEQANRLAEFEARWYANPRDLPRIVFNELYGAAYRELRRKFTDADIRRILR